MGQEFQRVELLTGVAALGLLGSRHGDSTHSTLSTEGGTVVGELLGTRRSSRGRGLHSRGNMSIRGARNIIYTAQRTTCYRLAGVGQRLAVGGLGHTVLSVRETLTAHQATEDRADTGGVGVQGQHNDGDNDQADDEILVKHPFC